MEKCLQFLISCSPFVRDCGEWEEGAGPRSDQRNTRSPGRGGTASPGGGAQRGGAGGAVPPDPQSPLEPSPGESVANTFQAGAHADARCRRTAGGESHLQSPRISGVGRASSSSCTESCQK